LIISYTQILNKNFRQRLLDHILARTKGDPYRKGWYDYLPAEHDKIVVQRNRLHEHKTIRFKSTTYDARRLEEAANPRSHADVMIHSYEDTHEGQTLPPYWHARIIGIYHLDIQMWTGSTPVLSPEMHIDVLFMRWFDFCSTDGDSGWRARRLHKI